MYVLQYYFKRFCFESHYTVYTLFCFADLGARWAPAVLNTRAEHDDPMRALNADPGGIKYVYPRNHGNWIGGSSNVTDDDIDYAYCIPGDSGN